MELDTLPQLKQPTKFQESFKLRKTKQRVQSSRKKTEDQLTNENKSQQKLYQQLPKYLQVCHDNMSRNVIVYIDQQQLKKKFQFLHQDVSEEVKIIDRQINKLKRKLNQEEQEEVNFLTQPKMRLHQTEEQFKKIDQQQDEEIVDLQEFIRKRKMIQITAQSMSVKKIGKPQNNLEHMKRIISKENTPVVPILACSSFKPKKTVQAYQIEAYLNDYKPFVNGEIGIIPRKLQEVNLQRQSNINPQSQQNLLIQNSLQ